MRHLANVLGIALVLAGCGRSSSSDAAKGAPSAAASADVPGVTGEPAAMAADLDELAGFLDLAVRTCQRSAAHAEAVAKLRQAQAASYADRDELKMRVDRKDLGDRDMRAWHREIKLRKVDVNVTARSCSKP